MRRSAVGSALVLLVAGAMILPTDVEAQNWSSMQLSRQYQAEERLDVEIQYTSGRFTLDAAEPSQLYGARLQYDEDRFAPIHQFDGGRLVIGVDRRGDRLSLGQGASDGELALTLSDQVILDLDLEFGAARAEIDLGGMRLNTFEFSTGASDTDIEVSSPNPEPMQLATFEVGAASLSASDLGRLNAAEIRVQAGVGDVDLDLAGLRRQETHIDVDMGVGTLVIRIPPQAGIRLVRDSFLTSLDTPDMERRDDAFYTENWDSSPLRVFIDVDAAFGSVSIRRSR